MWTRRYNWAADGLMFVKPFFTQGTSEIATLYMKLTSEPGHDEHSILGEHADPFHRRENWRWSTAGTHLALKCVSTIRYLSSMPGTGIRILGTKLMKRIRCPALCDHTSFHQPHTLGSYSGFPFFMPAYARISKVNVYGPPARDKSLKDLLKFNGFGIFFLYH